MEPTCPWGEWGEGGSEWQQTLTSVRLAEGSADAGEVEGPAFGESDEALGVQFGHGAEGGASEGRHCWVGS